MTYKAEWKHTEPLSPFPMVEAAERQIMIAIEARGITKSFGSAQVLKGISLSAEQGDVISIIGASGSGKSTFLRCLNLLEVPDSGEIRVGEEHLELGEGKNGIERRQVERIRRRVAMVFQCFNLWHHMTVVGNVIEAPIHVHGTAPRRGCGRSDGASGESRPQPSRQRLSRASSRAASSSAPQSRGRSRFIRASSSSTSRRPRSTRNSWAKCCP